VGNIKLTSPSTVKALLKENNIKLKKSLGQHFLCDENILNLIITHAQLDKNDLVIEIGAGIGTLTQRLAQAAGKVIAVEIDQRLIPLLEENLRGYRNVEILNADFLKVDLRTVCKFASSQVDKLQIVGNLPYQATSPILEKLIENRKLISSATLTVQQEVAEKIRAEPGSSESSALGVFVQAFADVKALLNISKHVFFPRPEIDSMLIRLEFLDSPRFESNEKIFFKVVRSVFNLRRKTIKKALSESPFLGLPQRVAEEVLHKAGINSARRGETLSLEELDRLAKAISGAISP